MSILNRQARNNKLKERLDDLLPREYAEAVIIIGDQADIALIHMDLKLTDKEAELIGVMLDNLANKIGINKISLYINERSISTAIWEVDF